LQKPQKKAGPGRDTNEKLWGSMTNQKSDFEGVVTRETGRGAQGGITVTGSYRKKKQRPYEEAVERASRRNT